MATWAGRWPVRPNQDPEEGRRTKRCRRYQNLEPCCVFAALLSHTSHFAPAGGRAISVCAPSRPSLVGVTGAEGSFHSPANPWAAPGGDPLLQIPTRSYAPLPPTLPFT